MRIRVAGWIVAGLVAMAPQVHAASLNVHGYTLGERVDIRTPGMTSRVNTAELSASLGAEIGKSFCIDIAQTIGIGNHFVEVVEPGVLYGSYEAAYLLQTWHPVLDTLGPEQTAITALQLAIWEVRYEDSDIGYSLANGKFSATASAAATSMAERMLGALPDKSELPTRYPGVHLALSDKVQDQIWIGGRPIPEPGSALLFFAGAIALSMIARRNEC